MTVWPDTADGDVFRRMKESGFDFSKEYDIDFNVDFHDWPPSELAISRLKELYPSLTVYEPDDEFNGYILFVIRAHLKYDLVIKVQNEVTDLMMPFGGRCESWGVMQP